MLADWAPMINMPLHAPMSASAPASRNPGLSGAAVMLLAL